MLGDITLLIPVGAGELAWRTLLTDLKPLPARAELIFIAVESQPEDLHEAVADQSVPCHVRWLQTEPNRARQLNYGAKRASRDFLWFLHADSRINSAAVHSLDKAICQAPLALHYFDLAFQSDGPALSRVNAWGANFRSRFLHLPFGDQGLCLSRDQFWRLGAFDEHAPYGEDHLLIWKARRAGISVRPVGARIYTSARKYAQHGWLRTTLLHLWRTTRQGLPQLAQTIRSRVSV